MAGTGAGTAGAHGLDGTHTGTPTNPSFPSGLPPVAGLVSAFTNKIVSADVAEIGFVDATTQQPLDMVLHATADLDGQWQTTTTTQLGNGSFTVTVTELLADGVTPFGPASAALAVTVDMPTLLLEKTPDGTGRVRTALAMRSSLAETLK